MNELIEKARYDLATLPMRQRTLRHMRRDPRQPVDGIRIIDRELERNAARIAAAEALLSDWF